MPFMQQQITHRQKWHQIETRYEGLMSFPADMFSAEWIAEQYEQSVEDVTTVEGYGARLSAPGYMDCTEWAVFDTPEEAQAYLDEYYPEEEEEESEDE